MEDNRKQCLICQEMFYPDFRIGERQRICSKEACQRERKKRICRRWAARNSNQRKEKLKLWAKSYPNYWCQYRERHPEYVARDNRRRCLSAKCARRSAKHIHIRTLRAEQLKTILDIGLSEENSAKHIQLARQINGIVDYLFRRDCSAKHIYIGLAVPFNA